MIGDRRLPNDSDRLIVCLLWSLDEFFFWVPNDLDHWILVMAKFFFYLPTPNSNAPPLPSHIQPRAPGLVATHSSQPQPRLKAISIGHSQSSTTALSSSLFLCQIEQPALDPWYHQGEKCGKRRRRDERRKVRVFSCRSSSSNAA